MDTKERCAEGTAAGVERPPIRESYRKPVLKRYGKVTDVTQKSGGAEDGGAAMMDKSGVG